MNVYLLVYTVIVSGAFFCVLPNYRGLTRCLVYIPLSSSCVCDDREQHVIFFLFQLRHKHFYGLVNKTMEQSIKTASFSVPSLPLSLVGPLLFYELWLPVLHLFVYISVSVCCCQ